MSGENKTIGNLLKHINSDFNSGLIYFKAGINNVISAISSGTKESIIIQSPINGFLLSELISETCKGVEFKVCDRKYVVFNSNDKCISVICDGNQLKFEVINPIKDNRIE